MEMVIVQAGEHRSPRARDLHIRPGRTSWRTDSGHALVFDTDIHPHTADFPVTQDQRAHGESRRKTAAVSDPNSGARCRKSRARGGWACSPRTSSNGPVARAAIGAMAASTNQ